MSLSRLITLSFYLLITSFACSMEQTKPEDCVRQYAQYINQGKLSEAKNMSTASGQAYLEALSEIILASASSLDTSKIKIKQVTCTEQGIDSVQCTSLEFDGFEEYKKQYWLVKSTKGWLVDHPSSTGAVETSEEVLEVEEEEN